MNACYGPQVSPPGSHVEVVPASEVARLAEALREATTALEFYADENHWLDGAAGEWIVEEGHPGSYDGFTHDEFDHDNGERARSSLARINQQTGGNDGV